MKPLLLTTAVALVSLLSHAGSPPPMPKWELSGTQDGIEIYYGSVPGSDLIAMRGKGAIDAPLWKLAAILLDLKRAPEWVDSLVESHRVRFLGPMQYIEYNHVGTPFILKDREFVSDVHIEVDPTQRTFAVKCVPTDDPAVPPSHHVRGEIVSGSFALHSLEAGKRVELDAELLCDPKGSVPRWVVNFFQKDWPLNTFRAIRVQAAKSDIEIPADFNALVETLRGF
jgi:hypothetical protein